MNEKETMSGTIFDEQGEMMVWEQLMDSYREGTVDQQATEQQLEEESYP